MRLGRVLGNVVATVKHPALVGAKLLLVDFETPQGPLAGRPALVLDAVDAGVGDRVLVVDEGNAAAQVLGRARGHRFGLARGFGGQLICVVPALELVVAVTSDPTRPARSGGYFGDLMRLVEDEIVRDAERLA